MDNVLVVDRERSSCFLVKSILLGRGCGVSIAATLKEARAKVQTGLFDALVIDVGEPANEMGFVEEVSSMLPGFPVVALFREEEMKGPFITLMKPLRVAGMSEAIRQALGRSPASWNRHNLDIPAVVSVGAQFVSCRTKAVSHHSLLLAPGKEFERVREFHEFFDGKLDRDFEGRLEFPGGEEPFKARAAYAEQTPDRKFRQVGLSIETAGDWMERVVTATAVIDEPAPNSGNSTDPA